MWRARVRGQHRGARGFTLVEVMVATLIFAIGMMAVITMEFSALRAYSASHHLTVATQMASRTLSVVQLERANWSRQEMGSLAQSGSLVPVYDTGSGTDPIDISILGSVTNTEWTWLRASPEPLSDRMRRDPQLGRYCVYVRGGNKQLAEGGQDVLDATTGGMRTVEPMVTVQVAVLYPTKSTSFVAPDCTSVRCEGSGDQLISDLLDPTGMDMTSSSLLALEECGWRATYASSTIRRLQ